MPQQTPCPTDVPQALDLEAALFEAYFACRQTKRTTRSALEFEADYEHLLIELAEDIRQGTYTPRRSIAFIVNRPVKREIFAADFRDRIVHHYLVTRLNPYLESVFSDDCYACRTGKGTHYGIGRIEAHIKRCSHDYTQDAYILKLDIEGFFMHIRKDLLWYRLEPFIRDRYQGDDKDLILNLARKTIYNVPTRNCRIKGAKSDWIGLPPKKSLFHAPEGCGLPIGNYTSQVFANFYLMPLDHFVERELQSQWGIRGYYGRYVDDFILIHPDKDFLREMYRRITDFLQHHLELNVHPRKVYLQHYSKGVSFLGSYLLPGRRYVTRRIKGNFYRAIQEANTYVVRHQKIPQEDMAQFLARMNSYLGILKHNNSLRFRKKMLFRQLNGRWWNYVYLKKNSGCFSPTVKTVKKNRKWMLNRWNQWIEIPTWVIRAAQQ